jgi:F420-dependent oxidoreductase-like protein
MLASQALTTSELCGGRVVLGIGLAHKPTVERSLGIPFEHPAAQMEEYLSVLLPAMQERSVHAEGRWWSADVPNLGGPPDVPVPSVMLAAMGPRMIELCGARTDGTILWLAGPRTIAEHLRPALVAAAERAGRGEPRIVASVPVCVTDHPDRAKEAVTGVLGGYGELPSYRHVMDLEGAAGPVDVSLIGDEATVRRGIERFAEAGTTDFSALEFTLHEEEMAATRSLLRSMC